MVLLVNIPRELNVIIYATLAINQPSHNTITDSPLLLSEHKVDPKTRACEQDGLYRLCVPRPGDSALGGGRLLRKVTTSGGAVGYPADPNLRSPASG